MNHYPHSMPLRRGDRYKATEFDMKIDATVFVQPDRARVITDTEHVILDVLPAPEDLDPSLQPGRGAWAGFTVAFFLILTGVWASVLGAYLLGFHR